MRLRHEDRKAVDLLLDRTMATSRGNGNGHVVYAAADGAIRERVARVETLLHLLDSWSASDPPRDSVARTVERIEQPASRRHRNLHAPSISSHHPLA